MKIYDAFLFFNELDLLEIRLELLYNHVDYFVISECDTTFSGLSKPFYYDENKHLFEKYADKIIHIKNYNSGDLSPSLNSEGQFSKEKYDIYLSINNFFNEVKNSPQTDNGKPHWCRDFLHREYVKYGMAGCQDDDIIIFSDLDEIPDPSKMKLDGESYLINQKNIIYYINKENTSDRWCGTFITKYSNVKDKSLNKLRNDRFSFEILENSGWHLTFMGGKDRIAQKIKSYGHQEYNNDSIISQISSKVDNNIDILNRGVSIRNINIDDYYPKGMIDMIKEKFNYLIG